jgi:hypothetical protein
MKISEILVESKQLDEGPLLNKIGSAVGKGVGTVAKGIGSVAGGLVGTGQAIKKGYQAGKAAVAGAGDEVAGTQKPAAAPTAAPTAAQINKAGPKGAPQAKAVTGAVAKQAMAKTGAALAGQDQTQAGQTMYAQVKANVDKLDKQGKQRIMQLLQKSLAAPAEQPAAAPAEQPAAAPAEQPAAAPAEQPAAAPASTKDDGNQPGFLQSKIKGRRKAPAPNQAEIDAERERIMGVTSDSVIRRGKVVAESFSLYRKK